MRVLYICISTVEGHREALLEGAIECLYTLGYARTTARAVVAASHTNLGSIAYHFGSIQALRDAALLEASERWLAPIVAATRARPPARRLEEGLRAFLASLPERRPLVVAFVEALAQVDRAPALRESLAAGYAQLRAAVAGDAADGATASLTIAVLDGLMVQWLIDPGAVGDGQALVDALPRLARLTALRG